MKLNFASLNNDDEFINFSLVPKVIENYGFQDYSDESGHSPKIIEQYGHLERYGPEPKCKDDERTIKRADPWCYGRGSDRRCGWDPPFCLKETSPTSSSSSSLPSSAPSETSPTYSNEPNNRIEITNTSNTNNNNSPQIDNSQNVTSTQIDNTTNTTSQNVNDTRLSEPESSAEKATPAEEPTPAEEITPAEEATPAEETTPTTSTEESIAQAAINSSEAAGNASDKVESILAKAGDLANQYGDGSHSSSSYSESKTGGNKVNKTVTKYTSNVEDDNETESEGGGISNKFILGILLFTLIFLYLKRNKFI